MNVFYESDVALQDVFPQSLEFFLLVEVPSVQFCIDHGKDFTQSSDLPLSLHVLSGV